MAQARTEFAAALNQIASEKGVDVEVVLEAIRAAALAAYKKDLMLRNEEVPEDFEEFTSTVDPITGEISIFHGKENVTPPGFARIAASIAKQVIMQRLNEAERGTILAEYESKVGTVISGSIQRQEGNTFFVDLGRAEGVLPPSEQVRSEMYHQNQRLKFLVKEIRESGRGSEVVVSRSDPNLVKALFALEVPEIQSGAVEIKVIAREAGSRTKIAASSTQEGVDPVGSLVGQKGVRVQAVISEVGEEKIDIISYSDDPARFIAASLSPAKDIQVRLNEKDKIATVTVPQSQLSLAIGKGGQNVRLAAKLTGWKIDIEGAEEEEPEVKEEKAAEEVAVEGTREKKEEPAAPVQNAPADDTKVAAGTEKEQIKEAIEKEVSEAEENTTTLKESKAAEEAGETLEKAVDEENPEQEKQKLEEAIGETEEAAAPPEEAKTETEKAEE
ncbi:transcription termination factor NusA [Candidatus Daviesbacteria bacterium RIFCSPHIGHO2_01_FULL_40_11]|uniref:Transcription termination/antitermination protein NusA n=1 Tax=Candidatus Daviesbacteria bacterium RIFCSPHIGHO2_01_FULL_40_11 TaxID=1797762 RepID=A0A1F5JLN9_9BACT|nr:MAG: transcription termination factor NusA [Candidatus Daviesbacteria bacterium RIFCSPHIGHO2_01_FULL_40_11]